MDCPKPPERVPVYFDAEFTGLRRETTLISIGLYSSEDGHYFYAEFTDYDHAQVDDWLRDHVIANRIFNDDDNVMDSTYISDDVPNDPYTVIWHGDSSSICTELCRWLKTISNHHGKKIQFYTDCYAYDWMLLNDLICDDGYALNLPDYIDYIPIDLSTALKLANVDPDVNREQFIGEAWVEKLKGLIKHRFGPDPKHNSLWDALVASLCFKRLEDEVYHPKIASTQSAGTATNPVPSSIPGIGGMLSMLGGMMGGVSHES